MSDTKHLRRILIVEDEALVSMLLETMLGDAGYGISGPAASVDDALALLEGGERPDAAILDVNLDGREVFPVAERLDALNIPFVFSTGYGEGGLPSRWQGRQTLHKPYTEDGVRSAILRALGISRA